MPVIQVLIISGLGAFLATGYCNILPAEARRPFNKVIMGKFLSWKLFKSTFIIETSSRRRRRFKQKSAGINCVSGCVCACR